MIDAGIGPLPVGMNVMGTWQASPGGRPMPGLSPVAGMRLGRYRLIEPLGRGCQGEVWRAMQVEPIVEEVALKLLTPDQADHPGRLSQFHREAEWGARLEGPALLPTYEFGKMAGYVFLAMPLVDGDSLSELIARRRLRLAGMHPPLRHWLDRQPREAFLRAMVEVAAQVARGLEVVHDARLVHRDIKPANILVDRLRPAGVYVCDFGLGRDLDDLAPAPFRDSTGTPLYMAPERLLGQFTDEVLCDVYSLGVTLFEAATLIHPFSVPDDLPRSDWPEYLAYTPPHRPRDLAPWLPSPLETMIRRAMSRNPLNRYPSMASFAGDLEGFASSAPMPPSP